LVVEAGVVVAQKAHWMPGLDDIGGDLFVGIYEGLVPNKSAAAVPFVFLDIDEASWQAWDEPLQTPRDKLARLIGFAARNQAKLIVVDVDLSRPTERCRCDPVETGKVADRPLVERFASGRSVSPDEELFGVLAMQSAAAENGAGRLAPIVLHQELRVDPRARDDGGFEIRRSFLEKTEEGDGQLGNPKSKKTAIHWAATLFEQSTDGLVRRWRLLAAACAEDRVQWLPSVQLLAATLVRPNGGGAAALYDALDDPQVRPPVCGGKPSARTITVADMSISLRPDALERRILFTIPWHPDERMSGAEVGLADTGGKARMLTRLSAARVAESEAQVWQKLRDDPPPLASGGAAAWFTVRERLQQIAARIETVSADLIKDRIVIIGGSFADARDSYRTPIGWMPGAVILANAIHSLRTYGPLHPPSLEQKAVLVLGSVLVVGLSFHFLPAGAATLVSLLIVLPLTVVLSTFWIASGVWVDATGGCVAIVIHSRFEAIKHMVEGIVGRRHAGHG
jgi:CHASE2 domain-containing sensor protein